MSGIPRESLGQTDSRCPRWELSLITGSSHVFDYRAEKRHSRTPVSCAETLSLSRSGPRAPAGRSCRRRQAHALPSARCLGGWAATCRLLPRDRNTNQRGFKT
ncbi:hypothetical protein AAFF_G00441470 [Aldrovandia affinis]|uniref:Uncharacterized protein n=1 Tax=Aldrovandia affinis TaxID=143900 RepID=A0AAD7S7H3_9TELE|nr:hypothetical protein AAFF_G00441470 [Aldrovandia affinis]